MNVESRAHRILRSLKLYSPIELAGGIKAMLPPIDSKESWIGVYCNKPNSIENAVAFSSEKLYVNKHGTWVSVTYRDILENKITQNKHEASEILVRTPNYSLIVPVHGGDDKVREAFEVLRFLNRVKEDVNRQNS